MQTNKQITYQLDPSKEDVFVIDKEHVAFKDNVCYPVYVSSKSYCTGFAIGRARVIFSDDGTTMLDVAPPMFGFRGGFDLIQTKNLEAWGKMATAFKKFKKGKKEYRKTRKKTLSIKENEHAVKDSE